MSSVIKRNPNGIPNVAGVYLIEPERSGPANAAHGGKRRSAIEETRSLIEEAKAEAERIVAAAESDAENVRMRGYKEGYDAGFEALAVERSAFEEHLAEIKTEVQRQNDEVWRALEPEILKLSVEVARRILRKEISEHQELVLSTIKEGILQLRESREIRVHVSALDYDFVCSHKEDLLGFCDGARGLDIAEDRSVDAGGCIIETGNGQLDARIETQLSQIDRAFMEEVTDAGVETDSEPE